MPQLMFTIYFYVLAVQDAVRSRLANRLTDRLVACLGCEQAVATEHPRARRLVGTRGQATTEYALVLLAAAMVALLVIAWASAGGGAAKISALFNRVIDAVIDRV